MEPHTLKHSTCSLFDFDFCFARLAITKQILVSLASCAPMQEVCLLIALSPIMQQTLNGSQGDLLQ